MSVTKSPPKCPRSVVLWLAMACEKVGALTAMVAMALDDGKFVVYDRTEAIILVASEIEHRDRLLRSEKDKTGVKLVKLFEEVVQVTYI